MTKYDDSSSPGTAAVILIWKVLDANPPSPALPPFLAPISWDTRRVPSGKASDRTFGNRTSTIHCGSIAYVAEIQRKIKPIWGRKLPYSSTITNWLLTSQIGEDQLSWCLLTKRIKWQKRREDTHLNPPLAIHLLLLLSPLLTPNDTLKDTFALEPTMNYMLKN